MNLPFRTKDGVVYDIETARSKTGSGIVAVIYRSGTELYRTNPFESEESAHTEALAWLKKNQTS